LSRKFLFVAVVFLIAASSLSFSQTIQRLTHQPPDGAGVGFLLTDGTVLCQGNGESDWYKLTPDNTGSYVNGTWARMANLPSGYVPDAFASAVLADGRVVITGGEYLNGFFTLTNLGAIYDPKANTWSNLPAPASWQYIGGFAFGRSSQRDIHGWKQADEEHRDVKSQNTDLDRAAGYG
jgi:N-acetylneuraminic acid mutarotase